MLVVCHRCRRPFEKNEMMAEARKPYGRPGPVYGQEGNRHTRVTLYHIKCLPPLLFQQIGGIKAAGSRPAGGVATH